MALKSTSISKNGSKGHHGFILTVYEDSINESSNTSSISFKLELYNLTNGGWDWSGWNTAIMAYVNINGNNYSNSIPSYGGSGYKTVCSGSGITVAHNDSSGEASITFSFEITENSYAAATTYTCGTAKNNGSMTLTTIPRYTTASVSIANDYQERTLNFSYTIGHECSSVQYYVNGTAYTASGLSAGTHNISLSSSTTPSIQAGTQYTIYVKATRKSSGKVTDSASQTITTYSYPYVKSISPTSFYIGQTTKLTADIYNPLKRSITIHMKNNSTGTEITQISTSSEGNVDLTPTTNSLYDTIGTNKSAAMAVYCKYGSTNTSSSKTGTYYTVESLARPNFSSGAVTWSDATSYSNGFTKDTTILIQNKGKLKIKLTTGATAARAAGTITYKATCGGQTINSLALNTETTFPNVFDIASTADLVITATDQRGYSTSMATKTINFYPYTPPTISASAHRQNNYEDKCYYTAAAGSSPCGGNNKITNFYFTYTLSGSAKTQSIGSGSTSVSKTEVEITNALPNANAYDLMFYAVDTLGATSSFRVTIPKGVPIFFIDTKNLAAGVNCFPSAKGFEVDGTIKGTGLNIAGNATITGNLTTTGQLLGNAKSLYPVAKIGSDNASTSGWYKVAESTMSGYGDSSIIYLIQGNYTPGYTGILDFHMRSDSTSIQCYACRWLARGHGMAYNDVRVVISGMKWTLYLNNRSSRYGRVSITELSHVNITGDKPDYTITYTNSTAPVTVPSGYIESKDAAVDSWPVNSIYFSYNSTSPASLFGGSWTQITGDYYLMLSNGTGTGGSNSTSYTPAGSVSSHTLTAAQIPSHNHLVTSKTTSYGQGSQSSWRCLSWTGTNADWSQDVWSGNAGGSEGHSHGWSGTAATITINPKYYKVYAWRRTA